MKPEITGLEGEQPIHARALAGIRSRLQADGPANTLRQLIRQSADRLPLPGRGHTLARWRALAEVASVDLGLAKLYEGHTDALAILAELGATVPQGRMWAVWCAEPPGLRVQATPGAQNARCEAGATVRLSGRKPWCSGAADVDDALISGWLPDGKPCLAAVSMSQPGIRTSDASWNAVGMASSASVDVDFDGASAVLVGPPGAYLARPGFTHGGAGVAACWYGASAGIATYVRNAATGGQDPHRLAHLGAIDVALTGAAALLREAATEIDAAPSDPCVLHVNRARLAVEAAAEEVLRRTPRAIGPGPMCNDGALAQLMADLPVFIRQSHAERDQAAHGLRVAEAAGRLAWGL